MSSANISIDWTKDFEKNLSVFIGRNFQYISKRKLREAYFSAPVDQNYDKLVYTMECFGYSIQTRNALRFSNLISDVSNLILDSQGNIGFVIRNQNGVTIRFGKRSINFSEAEIGGLADYNLLLIFKEFEQDFTIKKRLRHLNFFKSVGTSKVFAISIASTFSNILGLISSIYIMVVYDRVLPNQAEHSLYALSIGVGIAVGFDLILKFIRSTFIEIANKSSQDQVIEELFEQYVEHVNVSNTKSTGSLYNVSRDYENYRDFISSATITALIDFPFIFVFIGVMYLISGPLCLVPLIAVPILLFAIVLSQPVLLQLSRKLSSANQSKQSNLLEIFSGLDEIRVNGGYSIMKRRFLIQSENQSQLSERSKKISEFNGNLIAITQQLAQVAIIVYGYHLFVSNQITMGAIIASVILSGKTLQPLAKIAQTLSKTNGAITAYKNVKEFLSMPRFRKVNESSAMASTEKPLLDFSNLTFRYTENSPPVFQNLNLSLRTGEKVAVLGRNGAGKSTLIKLAAGILRPETGNVLLFGLSVSSLDRADAKSQVALVNQNPWIFSGTLRENITMGHDLFSDEEIVNALSSSGIPTNSDTESLLDLKINDNGTNLSGGQKQTLSIARVLLNNPKIILFDEPTSALDAQTEKMFLEGFSEKHKNTAAIFVTHKPEVVARCTRVVIIDQNKITWDGPRNKYFQLIQQKQKDAKV